MSNERDLVFDNPLSEIDYLLAVLRDRELADSELARLDELVAASKENSDYYVQRMFLAASLEWDREKDKGERIRDKCAAVPQSSLLAPRSFLQRTLKHERIVAIAAGVTFVAALLGWAASTYLPNVVREEEESQPVVEKHVAILNGERGVKWIEGERTKAHDPRLWPGEKLVIEEGLIELKYLTGARVVIEGPAEFYVGAVGDEGGILQGRGKTAGEQAAAFIPSDSQNSGYLTRGKLVARCETQASKGFTVCAPSGCVVDLGTEFGVDVDGRGKMQVAVVTGKIELISGDGARMAQRVRLTKGEGALVAAGGSITHQKKVDSTFVSTLRSQLAMMAEDGGFGPSTRIVNAGFEEASGDAGRGNLATVAGWIEETADSAYVDDNGTTWTPENDRMLYLNGAGSAVNQTLRHEWSSNENYTLRIIGVEPRWRASSPGDAFRIQLRQAGGILLWDSGPQSVDNTVVGTANDLSYAGTGHIFHWTIDAGKFVGVAGAVEGSRLNIRIVAESGSPYLDDVSLSASVPDAPKAEHGEAEPNRVDHRSDSTSTVTFEERSSRETSTTEHTSLQLGKDLE